MGILLRIRGLVACSGVCTLVLLLGGCGKSMESKPVGPNVISQPPLEAEVGQEYTYVVVATGNPTLTFRLEQAPVGMTIDSTTGLISWTPTADSHFDTQVSVVASNRIDSTSHDFVIQVKGLHIDGWETGGLVTSKINPETIRGVAADIRAGTYPKIKSLLIVRDGLLVFENYFSGANRNTAMNIYSAEKSITSCLMGIAIDNGHIAGVNELLYPFFPEYDNFENWSEWKQTIALKHLLNMTSGFELEGNSYDLWLNNIGQRDWIKFYLDLPVVFVPGRYLYYKSLCDRLVGHVIEREAQTTLPAFAAEHLFEPLGMAQYDWNAWDPAGSSMISSQLKLRAIDMAKVGQMYLNGGVWQGDRIVSEDWVASSITPFRSNYGYNWWIHEWATSVGPVDVYYAAGNGGNSIFVFDELQMVVVFTGDYFVQPDQFDQQFNLLKQRIIPATTR